MEQQGYTIDQQEVSDKSESNVQPMPKKKPDVFTAFGDMSIAGSGLQDIFKLISKDTLFQQYTYKPDFRQKQKKFKRASFKDYKIDQVIQESRKGFMVYINLKNLAIESKKAEIKDLKITSDDRSIGVSFMWNNVFIEGSIAVPSGVIVQSIKLNNYYLKDYTVLVLDYVYV